MYIILQVQNEIKKWCFKRKLNTFNTRSILLSSWRKPSKRLSRDMTRDTHITEGTHHIYGKCTDTCKLNKNCCEHAKCLHKDRATANGRTLALQSENVNSCKDGEV
jgi:hypothetical protein